MLNFDELFYNATSAKFEKEIGHLGEIALKITVSFDTSMGEVTASFFIWEGDHYELFAPTSLLHSKYTRFIGVEVNEGYLGYEFLIDGKKFLTLI